VDLLAGRSDHPFDQHPHHQSARHPRGPHQPNRESPFGIIFRGSNISVAAFPEEARLLFKIHTFSRLGNIFTELVGPLFSVPNQAYCTRTAVLNLKRQAEQRDFG